MNKGLLPAKCKTQNYLSNNNNTNNNKDKNSSFATSNRSVEN